MIGFNPSAKTRPDKKWQPSGVTWRHATAGAVSGCATRFICQPLDIIKIRFQLQLEPIRRHSVSSKYRSIPHAVRTIVAEEGFRALWKAHLCAQALSAVYGMIQFSSFELYTEAMNRSWLMDSDRQREFARRHQHTVHFLCGSMAGFSATLAAHPLDVIRTRLIAQSEPRTYRSTPHAFRMIVGREGLRGLFRGLVPTLVQIAPYTGMQFTVYNTVYNLFDNISEKSSINKLIKLTEDDDPDHQTHNSWIHFEKTFVCGAISGLLAKLTVYPLDLIKKRLQVEGFQNSRRGFGAVATYKGLVDCIVQIIRQERMLAFYKGLTPSLVKAALVTAFHFSLYENAYKFLSSI